MLTTILTFLKANKLAAGLGGALLLLAIVTGSYFKGREAGVEATEGKYAAMALEAAKKAREASERATANKDTRDDKSNTQQAEIEDAVNEAINSGDDPVAAYFDQLRQAQSGSGETAD